jgi:hypothetical protein
LGGWAAVDKETGEVLTVTVGNYNSMEDWEYTKRRMAERQPGVVMRFQTGASEDGNVAGWNNAQWDEKSDRFVLNNQSSSGGVSSQSTTTIRPGVVPGDERSLRNYMSTRTKLTSSTTYTDEQGNTATQRVEGTLSNYQKEDRTEGPDVRLSFPDSPIESESFDYSSPQLAIESFEADVDAALTGEGLSLPVEPEVLDSSESAEPDQSEGVSLAEAVRGLATRMVEFFTGWFGAPVAESESPESESSGSETSDEAPEPTSEGIPETIE